MANVGSSARGVQPAPQPVKRIRRRAETVTLFTRQMATLLDAGVPLMKALETLTRQQQRPDFKRVLGDLANGVRAGNPFSEGIQQFPHIFDHLYLNMIKAGEAGGILEGVMARLARFQEKAQKIKGNVQAAMVYPLIVILVAVGIVGFLTAYVIPQFQTVFDSILRGQALPPLTQLVIDASTLVQSHGWALLVAPLICVVAGRGLKETELGEKALDGIMLRLPLVGDLSRRIAIVRFTRTLGTLVASDVPILAALTISQSVLGNRHLRDAIETVHTRVRDGDTIALPLAQTAVFPPMVTSMLEVGEATGRLGDMCDRIADTYEEEVDNAVSALTRIIEPVMIVLLAVVVGTIVIALFLPIVSLIQNLNAR